MTRPDAVVVWGNCQAEPIATLLTEPLRAAGLRVVPVPPVFLTDPAGLDRVRAVVGEARWLVSQPIADEYRVPGCGTDQLAGFLPPQGELLRIPSAYDTAAFPCQVLAHDGSGARIAAPLTNYHDLRIIAAAARGDRELTIEEPSPEAIAAHADAAWAELRRRGAACDLDVTSVIRADQAMFAVNHPSNVTLGHVATGLLRLMGLDAEIPLPDREFLGSTRTPVEPGPARLLGWTPTGGDGWRVGAATIPWETVVRAHLDFYADHPDVIADSLQRFATRLAALGI